MELTCRDNEHPDEDDDHVERTVRRLRMEGNPGDFRITTLKEIKGTIY